MAADLQQLGRKLDGLAAELRTDTMTATLTAASVDIAEFAGRRISADLGADRRLSNLKGSSAATATAKTVGEAARIELEPAGALVLASGGAARHVIPGRRLRLSEQAASSSSAGRGTLYRIGPVNHPGTAGTGLLADIAEIVQPAARDALDVQVAATLDRWAR